jgi:hypothetical protein
MAFVKLGTRYGQGDPAGTIGYDGQFSYQIAVRLFDAVPYLDIPAYRLQRILYPLTARLAGLGKPGLIVWWLIWLNIVALTAGTHAMGSILAQQGLSRWYALTVGLFAGQLVSLRLNLNEPFSLTFAVLGVYAFETNRPRWGAVALALSMLSKETAIAFVGGYLAYFFFCKQWRMLVETGLISLTPYVLWQFILWFYVGEFGLRSGGQGATSFSLLPFGGLLGFELTDPAIFLTVLLILGPLIILPCITLTVRLARYFLSCVKDYETSELLTCHPVAIILALHILMMTTLPHSTYADLPGMLRLTSGLVISTILFGAIIKSHKLLNYSTFWLVSVAMVLFVM